MNHVPNGTAERAGSDESHESLGKMPHQTAERAHLPSVLNDLPPFPIVAIKALQLVSNEKAPMRELSELIRTDAALSGEILRIANSALYGLRIEVESALTAMVLLGLDRIKSVVVTSALRHYIGKSLDAPWMRICWRHSLATALLAKELAKGTATSEDVAYTAGILHDIGRLALAMAFPTRYSEFILNPEPTSLELLEAERELFGIDHCQTGEILTSKWNLPPNLIIAAAQHHDLPRGSDPGVLTLVRYGCRLADVLGFEVVRANRRATYEDLIAELPPPSKLPADQQDLSFRIASKINSIEMS